MIWQFVVIWARYSMNKICIMNLPRSDHVTFVWPQWQINLMNLEWTKINFWIIFKIWMKLFMKVRQHIRKRQLWPSGAMSVQRVGDPGGQQNRSGRGPDGDARGRRAPKPGARLRPIPRDLRPRAGRRTEERRRATLHSLETRPSRGKNQQMPTWLNFILNELNQLVFHFISKLLNKFLFKIWWNLINCLFSAISCAAEWKLKSSDLLLWKPSISHRRRTLLESLNLTSSTLKARYLLAYLAKRSLSTFNIVSNYWHIFIWRKHPTCWVGHHLASPDITVREIGKLKIRLFSLVTSHCHRAITGYFWVNLHCVYT